MENQPTVITRSLTTGYMSGVASHIVSTGISEKLYPGKLTSLLGPNGAGKSTLLKTLSGFIPPIEGEILIEGRPMKDYGARELARKVGVVLTDRVTSPNITALELVKLGRSPYTGFWGHTTEEDREIAEQSLRLTGVEPLSLRRVSTLSDGERQKVMIAKALAQQTPVIFLDEPTAFLDYPSKVEILLLLRNLARSGNITIFLSTHDLEIALQLSDTLWLMDKNLGIITGSPSELSGNGIIGRYFNRTGLEYVASSRTFKILDAK